MNRTKTLIKGSVMVALLLTVSYAFAGDFANSNVGAGGYDLVAYQTHGTATRGTGWHAVLHEGTTYLFASKQNRKAFEKHPDRYLPQYGGYCAYGLSVGKKFYADPTVWKVVDGKLYLNLDSKIQKKFEGDLSANIEKADAHWPRLKNENPTGL